MTVGHVKTFLLHIFATALDGPLNYLLMKAWKTAALQLLLFLILRHWPNLGPYCSNHKCVVFDEAFEHWYRHIQV